MYYEDYKESEIQLDKYYLGYFAYISDSTEANCYGIIQLVEGYLLYQKKINLAYASRRQMLGDHVGHSNILFKVNDFVTFKFIESKHPLFKYEAFDVKEAHKNEKYLMEQFDTLEDFKHRKWLYLGLSKNLLDKYIENETKKWKDKLADIYSVFNNDTKRKVIDSLTVNIEMNGSSKLRDDDTLFVYFKTKFENYEGREHLYLFERFGYNKCCFKESSYRSYYDLFSDYKKTTLYVTHKKETIEIKDFIVKEIEMRYDLEKHKKMYIDFCNNEIVSIERNILKKIKIDTELMKNNDWL